MPNYPWPVHREYFFNCLDCLMNKWDTKIFAASLYEFSVGPHLYSSVVIVLFLVKFVELVSSIGGVVMVEVALSIQFKFKFPANLVSPFEFEKLLQINYPVISVMKYRISTPNVTFGVVSDMRYDLLT